MWFLANKPNLNSHYVYEARDYLLAHSFKNGEQVCYLHFSDTVTNLVLPVLKRTITGDFFELTSAYGYGGFYGWGNLNESSINELKLFLKNERIVHLFIRHDPMKQNHRILPQNFTELNRKTYSIKCDKHANDHNVQKFVNSKFRRAIRRANQYQLNFSFDQINGKNSKYQKFIKQYYNTMVKNNAMEFYFFDNNYFGKIRDLKDTFLYLASVETIDGDLLASAIFFVQTEHEWSHYHLGGSNNSCHAMELLFSNVAKSLHQLGCPNLHLGGGHTLDGSDGLSRFKRKISDNEHEFFVSKIASDDRLSADLRQNITLERPNYFLISDMS